MVDRQVATTAGTVAVPLHRRRIRPRRVAVTPLVAVRGPGRPDLAAEPSSAQRRRGEVHLDGRETVVRARRGDIHLEPATSCRWISTDRVPVPAVDGPSLPVMPKPTALHHSATRLSFTVRFPRWRCLRRADPRGHTRRASLRSCAGSASGSHDPACPRAQPSSRTPPATSGRRTA